MGTDVLTRSATHVDTRACAHEHTRRLNGHTRISVENHLRMTRSGCVGGQQDVDMSLGGRREGGGGHRARAAWPRSPVRCHSSRINSFDVLLWALKKARGWGNCPLRLQIWMTEAAEQPWVRRERGSSTEDPPRLIPFPPHYLARMRETPQDLDTSSQRPIFHFHIPWWDDFR